MHHCFKPARTWFLVLSVDQLPISMFADCFFSRSHGTTDCSQPWVQNSPCPPILEKSWGRIEIGDYNKTKENVRWRTKQQRNLFLLVTWRTRMCGVCAYAQEGVVGKNDFTERDYWLIIVGRTIFGRKEKSIACCTYIWIFRHSYNNCNLIILTIVRSCTRK